MSEKITGKAVELSDDELSGVAGGKGMLVMKDGPDNYAFHCEANISAEEFYTHRCIEKIYNNCSAWVADSYYYNCENCPHYRKVQFSSPEALDAYVSSQSGYSIKSVGLEDIAY